MTEAAAGSLRAALRHRGFPRFLSATVISAMGDFLNSVGVAVLVYQATGSAGWLAVVAVARTGAWAASTAVGGVVGDRFDRRSVLVLGNLGGGVLAALLTATALFDLPVLFPVAVATALDFAAGLMNPSFAAAVPALVGEDDIAAATGAVTTVEQVSMVVGPALGALLVAVWSPGTAFGVNAATYLVAASLMVGVPAGGNVVDDGEPTRFRDGVAVVRASRSLSVLIALFVAAVSSFGFSMVLLLLLAERQLGLGDSGVGWLRMAEGVGGVAAAVVAGRFAARGRAPTLSWVAVVLGVVPCLLAVIDSAALALICLGVAGGAYVVFEVMVVTWLQRLSADATRARVMGLLMSLGALGTAAGAAAAPVVEGTAGLGWALVASGLVVLVPLALLGPSLPPLAAEAAERGDELAPYVEALGGLALFEGADAFSLERLAGAVTPVQLGPDAVIMSEGDTPDDLYLVRSGELKVTSVGEAGGPARLVNTMGPGDWFGEIGLIQRRPRTATVTTDGEVELWRIPGEVFLEAFEAPALRPDVLRTGVAVRLARTHPSRVAT
jgi:predicted MFS family arabinose efflux permease